MRKDAKIMIAGHRGMVGSALARWLGENQYTNLILVGRPEVDLREPHATLAFMDQTKPEYLFVAAAKVGGIMANSTCPAEFLRDNLLIQTNVIDSAYRVGVKKLLFLGSSCIYPKLAPQPLRETALLTGLLEPTNEAYALAKITGLKLCDAYHQQFGCNFVSAMPCNLYGYGDNFRDGESHVIPGLIRRFHEAKTQNRERVTCWGTGQPLREFMFVDDLAEALVFLMERFDAPGFVNVGTEEEVTIRELTRMIADVVDYRGAIEWDATIPDGTPRKILDSSRLHALGWRHRTSLAVGLRRTYGWFLDHHGDVRL